MVVNIAKKYVGYLEHQSEDLIGVFTANSGKGGYTIFSLLVNKNYRWRNFNEVPWCTTFIHAIFIEALGKKKAKKLLGKPHPGSKVLYRRFKRSKRLTKQPKKGDLIFLTNGSGAVEHCGIVVDVNQEIITTIEGNTIDPTGVFKEKDGGAVAYRFRKITDPNIIAYGGVNL